MWHNVYFGSGSAELWFVYKHAIPLLPIGIWKGNFELASFYRLNADVYFNVRRTLHGARMLQCHARGIIPVTVQLLWKGLASHFETGGHSFWKITQGKKWSRERERILPHASLFFSTFFFLMSSLSTSRSHLHVFCSLKYVV